MASNVQISKSAYILYDNNKLKALSNVKKILTKIKKKRIIFYGHLRRTEVRRLTNQILTFRRINRLIVSWVNEARQDKETKSVKK